MCRPAAVAPARTHSAERRACSGVSQLKSTASATSPARRHIWGPSAATTRRTGSSDRNAATPSRTRLRAPGFGLPTPRRRRPRGSALARTPWTMLSGPRVWRGITPIPSSICRVSFAASASAASPSVAPGWFTQKELYPSPSASRADARMISGAAPANNAKPRHMANRWVALAIVFVTRTSMGYQFQSVASVGPLLVSELGLTWAQLGLLIGLYMLPGAFFALPSGVVGQRLGERRTVVGSLALMVVGGLVTAASPGFTVAAAGRLLSGIGAVLMNILLAKMVADWFAEREMSTAMAVMLTSWPVGLGVAAATLGGLATRSSWRMAIVATALAAALGLVLIAFAYRDPSRTAGGAAGAPPARRAGLAAREVGLAVSAGLAWGCFNASLVAVVAFGPAMLMARGLSLGNAGFVVSLAIWVTILSVPLGGLLTDRLRRPNLSIVAGSLAAGLVTMLLPVLAHPLLAFCLLGLATGVSPGAVMALVPRAVAPQRLATALGVYYAVFYVVMAATQLAAGVVRDAAGSPAAPIRFAAFVMASTVLGLALFRLVERATPRAGADERVS